MSTIPIISDFAKSLAENKRSMMILAPFVGQSTLATHATDTPRQAAKRGALVMGLSSAGLSLYQMSKVKSLRTDPRMLVMPIAMTAAGATAGLAGHFIPKGFKYVRSKLH